MQVSKGTLDHSAARDREPEGPANVENRLRRILDGLGPSMLVGLLTPGGILIEANRSALLADEAWRGKRFDEVPAWSYSAEVRVRLLSAMERAARGLPSRYDERVRSTSGELIDVDFSLHPLTDAAGRIVYLLPSAVIVSERKRVEERLRKLSRTSSVLSAIKHQILHGKDVATILSSACDIVVHQGQYAMAWIGMVSQPGALPQVRAHAGGSPDTIGLVEKLLCAQPDENCAMTMHALAEHTPAICNDIEGDPRSVTWRSEALRRGYRSMASFPLLRRGSVAGILNVYASRAHFFDADEMAFMGELSSDVAFAIEVNAHERERRAAEDELRATQKRFRMLAENVHEVFWIRDPASCRVLYATPAFERIWGRSCESLYASPCGWLAWVHPDDREHVTEAMEHGTTSEDIGDVYRIVQPWGTFRWVRDRAFAVRGDDGQVVQYVGTTEDITEQKKLEEQVQQSQRLDAIGQLAGGIAHDFNNILTIIQGFASMLKEESLPEAAADASQEILNAAQRAAQLTRQLLAFGRRQVMQCTSLDLNAVILSVTSLVRRVVGEDIHLQVDLHSDPLWTFADAGMLDQVIINLVVNSRDAMPNGGTLRIETFERTVHESEVSGADSVQAGSYVGVRVTDSGSGIPAHDLPHIFEPFFTTKAQGKGTGLGLAMVYGIVRQHRGEIRVQSASGRGTTFEVLLPASKPGRLPPAERDTPVAAGGHETILLVEDDPHVRALTCRVLEKGGYRVLQAGSGPEAIEVWNAAAEAVDLVLTDVIMPGGMDGRELVARLREKRPQLRVVYMSGYTPHTAGRELQNEALARFLQKPASPPTILQALRECLDQKLP